MNFLKRVFKAVKDWLDEEVFEAEGITDFNEPPVKTFRVEEDSRFAESVRFHAERRAQQLAEKEQRKASINTWLENSRQVNSYFNRMAVA